jgi:hypothetical protein
MKGYMRPPKVYKNSPEIDPNLKENYEISEKDTK